MIRKIRKVISTLCLFVLHPTKVTVKGIQDLPINTEIRVIENGCITFGKRTSALKRVSFVANNGNIVIGDYCFFNRNCLLISQGHISIGDRCIFGPNVVVYDHDHVYDRNGFVSGKHKIGTVVIDNNCWIGANVTILRGTHVGEGCVIGAGAIIQGDIPAHSIVKSDRKLVIKALE